MRESGVMEPCVPDGKRGTFFFEAKLRALLERELQGALPVPIYWNNLLCQEILDAPAGVLPLVDTAAETVVSSMARIPEVFNGPFNSLLFSLYRRTGDNRCRADFEALARLPLLSLSLSPEGAWTHPRGKFGEGEALLIDSFQEESSRLFRLAGLLHHEKYPESDADALEHLALRQFELHRALLRDPVSGLWNNGRGWRQDDPQALSPGAWSRGHGWLLRGLCASLEFAAVPTVREGLAGLIRETADALLRVQDEDGLWHALLHLPATESPVDSSGSAMIASGLLAGVRLAALPENPYAECAQLAARSLFELYVTPDGRVVSICPGPGPLSDESFYRVRVFSDENPHGAFAMVGLAAELLRHGEKASP
jgi:rhamnogalacturonyl hydrolase YesR